MKHVLVLFSNNFSNRFIGEQRPAHFMAGNTDTCDAFNPDGSVDEDQLKMLQTTDGIQLYHFKHVVPRAPDAEGPIEDGDLEAWIEKLLLVLRKSGEALDAVVVPTFAPHDHKGVLKLARDLKQRIPSLKVMIENPNLFYDDPEKASEFGRHAWPLSKDREIKHARPSVVISNDTPDYKLAEGIDVVTKNVHGDALANALRDMLGMERLPEVKKGRGAA